MSVDGFGIGQLLIVVGGNALRQTRIDFRADIALNHIPHLRLAGTAMTLHRQFVVGMHLYGEVLA